MKEEKAIFLISFFFVLGKTNKTKSCFKKSEQNSFRNKTTNEHFEKQKPYFFQLKCAQFHTKKT